MGPPREAISPWAQDLPPILRIGPAEESISAMPHDSPAPNPANRRPLLRPLWDLLAETYQSWRQDNAQTLGAALAFYTMFSLAIILMRFYYSAQVFFIGAAFTRVYANRQGPGAY